MIPAAALPVAIRRGNVGVAHGIKQCKDGALACVDFQIGVFVHERPPFAEGVYAGIAGQGAASLNSNAGMKSTVISL